MSALINLSVADYYERGGTRWLRFQEKRGKEHDVPVHSKAKEAVDLWLERSCLALNPSAPLFPSFGKNREGERDLETSLLSQLPCDGNALENM